jgi:hypothetical protein
MLLPNSYEGQNWMVVPTPSFSAGNASVPQSFLFTFSGVANLSFKGRGGGFRRETIWLHFQDSMVAAKAKAMTMQNVIAPPDSETNLRAEQWVPYASIGGYFNKNHAVDSGFGVDRWRPAPFRKSRDAVSGVRVDSLWNGVYVDVAAADSDGELLSLAYHVTLVAALAFTRQPCRQESAAVQSARQTVNGLIGRIEGLQASLQSAPPWMKAHIIDEIEEASEELTAAQAILTAATRALEACNVANG